MKQQGAYVKIISHKIDSYTVKIYASDLKGRRTRWGDKVIQIFSGEKEVAQAVFAIEGSKIPEPYFEEGKIFYFAPSSQFEHVLSLLRSSEPVYIAWEPIHDPKEPKDGDAYFFTKPEQGDKQ
jgi:hypothetical protein